MVKTLKYIGYIILLGLAIISLYMINLFAMKPYSIDHYLAKELTMGLLDSPEFMTYIGCLLYTSPSPRDVEESRMPSSA